MTNNLAKNGMDISVDFIDFTQERMEVVANDQRLYLL